MHINTGFLQYCLVKLKIFRRQIGRGTIFNNFEKGQAQALLLMLYKQKNISLLLKNTLSYLSYFWLRAAGDTLS